MHSYSALPVLASCGCNCSRVGAHLHSFLLAQAWMDRLQAHDGYVLVTHACSLAAVSALASWLLRVAQAEQRPRVCWPSTWQQ